MKWLVSVLVFTGIQFVYVTSIQSNAVEKRDSFDDVATIGYATLNGGTSGGSGGTITTVTTLDALTSALKGPASKVVVISGTIVGNVAVGVGSNTSVIGLGGSSLVGVGLSVLNERNVIIRNVKISKVLAEAGDFIGVQASSQVWIDHVDLSSDRDHDDVYGGLLNITHGSNGITVTNSRLYTHQKASVVGDSDSNGAEDSAITVTYGLNYWNSLGSLCPSFRFGHGHLFNNVFQDNGDGISVIDGAQLIVESNVWDGVAQPLRSVNGGLVSGSGNDWGGGSHNAPQGTFITPPYPPPFLLPILTLKGHVFALAGQTLSF